MIKSIKSTNDDRVLAEELGELPLCLQVAEECGELSQAVIKYLRTYGIGSPTPVSSEQALQTITEEMADVIISCVQLSAALGISDDDINSIRVYKTQRQKARIDHYLKNLKEEEHDLEQS